MRLKYSFKQCENINSLRMAPNGMLKRIVVKAL